MNPNPQAIVAEALQKGWISIKPEPVKPPYRQRLYAAGLTAHGTPRKPALRPAKVRKIMEIAERDGVTVTAIYQRLKRTGKMTLE